MKTDVRLYQAKRPTRGDPKRKVWLIRWYGTDGRRYCETIGVVGKLTKREAEAIRRDKQSKIDCNVTRPNRPKRITLSALIDRHVEAIKIARQPRTIRQFRTAGNHAVAALGGETVAAKIDRAAADRVVRHLSEAGLSRATIRKTISKLRTVFRRALDENLVAENPFASIELPKIQPRQKRIFTRDEVVSMLKEAPSAWWTAFITVAVGSGLRLGELLNLTWRDVDLKRGEITVAAKRAGRFEVSDDGDFPIFEWSAKSHTERVVTISDEAVEALTELRGTSDGSVYVFVCLERLLALDAKQKAGTLRGDFEIVNNVLRDFKTIQSHAFTKMKGEHPIGTVHDLRKTYGTWMSEAVPMHVLQRLMGHADISTTARFYLGTVDAYSDRIRNALSVKTDAHQTRKPDFRSEGDKSTAA
ncbi:MAG: tyrosine-type recombinase/integrase [Planctomycetes bacterium]|nr:tyrosine-type recombinase/integrase [Planctomycetota bacterium]